MRHNISRCFFFCVFCSISIHYLFCVCVQLNAHSTWNGLLVFHAKWPTNMWPGTLFDLCHFAWVINNILYFYYYILLCMSTWGLHVAARFAPWIQNKSGRQWTIVSTEESDWILSSCFYSCVRVCVCMAIKQTFLKKSITTKEEVRKHRWNVRFYCCCLEFKQ